MALGYNVCEEYNVDARRRQRRTNVRGICTYLLSKVMNFRVVPGLPIADNHSNFHLKTTTDHIAPRDAHLKTIRQVCTSI